MNGTKSRGDDESRRRVERLTRRVCSDRPSHSVNRPKYFGSLWQSYMRLQGVIGTLLSLSRYSAPSNPEGMSLFVTA